MTFRTAPGGSRAVTIRSIEVRALAPDVERFRYTAFEPEVFTTTTLVRVTDDDGTTGYGAYDSDSYGDWDRAPLETLRTARPPPARHGRSTTVEAAAAVLTEDRHVAVPAGGAVGGRHRDVGRIAPGARAVPLRAGPGRRPASTRSRPTRRSPCSTTKPPISRRSRRSSPRLRRREAPCVGRARARCRADRGGPGAVPVADR